VPSAPSTTVESALQIKLFMQNKAKFRKTQMNVNKVLTKDYENRTLGEHGKKQSQTNPNKAKFKKAKMNVTSIITKAYENKSPFWAPKKQSQYKPKTNPILSRRSLGEGGQTQPVVSLSNLFQRQKNLALRSVAQSYGLLTEDKFHGNDSLDVESEVYDVAVLDDVVFSFEPDFAGGFDSFFAAELFEVFKAKSLSFDKTSLNIGMHFASRIKRNGALLNRPGAQLIRDNR